MPGATLAGSPPRCCMPRAHAAIVTKARNANRQYLVVILSEAGLVILRSVATKDLLLMVQQQILRCAQDDRRP